MDPVLLLVRLIDRVVQVVLFLWWTPTRAARARLDDLPLPMCRSMEWAFAGDHLTRSLQRPTACGCMAVRGRLTAFDIDCPTHDPLQVH